MDVAAAAVALPNLNAITHSSKQGKDYDVVQDMGKDGQVAPARRRLCGVSHLAVDREQQSGRLSSV